MDSPLATKVSALVVRRSLRSYSFRPAASASVFAPTALSLNITEDILASALRALTGKPGRKLTGGWRSDRGSTSKLLIEIAGRLAEGSREGTLEGLGPGFRFRVVVISVCPQTE